MKILAFDTSGKACSVALCHEDKEKVLHEVMPMQQASSILPMINDLLSSFSLCVSELDAIAYGCGPGSFTGVRIASSVAQALSFAHQVPIIRISSLRVMAHTAFLDLAWHKLLIAVDAKCGDIYWAVYEYNQNGNLVSMNQEYLCKKENINTLDKSEEWYGIGDGWEQYYSDLTMHLGFAPLNINISLLPHAKALLNLAKSKYIEGDFVSQSEALPHYLR